MMPDFSNAVILFGGGLSLLLGIGQLLSPRRGIRSILLFVIFSSIAVFQYSAAFPGCTRGIY
jgi:hypothetical protein